MKNITFLLILFAAIIPFSGSSQEVSRLPLTADSLASGNYKDVLTSFFQIAVNKLTSKEKEIGFSSNPFAVMVKMDSTLLSPQKYVDKKHLRYLNFSFAAKMDSAYKFNGFSSTVKYAILNKRDETVSDFFISQAFKANEEYNLFNDSINALLSTIPIDNRAKYREQYTKMRRGEATFRQLDAAFQKLVLEKLDAMKLNNFRNEIINNPDINFLNRSAALYDSVKNEFNKKLLWTVGISDTTYSDQFMFSNLLLSTQVLQGLSKANTGMGAELDIRLSMGFRDDTLKAGRDLKRNILTFEPGINLIFRNKQTGYPWGEFKISGSLTRNMGTLYLNEEKSINTINGTLRIRIIGDLWVPLEIKYDPENGNFLGFLNVRGNFTGLKNLMKSLKPAS